MGFWLSNREKIGIPPRIEGSVAASTPFYVEYYSYHAREASNDPLDGICLFSQLDGAAVDFSGQANTERSHALPLYAGLLKPNTAVKWRYSGTIDFVAFYLTDPTNPITQAFIDLTEQSSSAVLVFKDPLFHACAAELVALLGRGQQDEKHTKNIADLMFSQALKVLTEHPRSLPHISGAYSLKAVCEHIDRNLATQLTADKLSSLAGLSTSHFRKRFFAHTGQQVHAYVMTRRLGFAKKLLEGSRLPISEVAVEAGFYSQSHLTRCIKSRFGITPMQLRKAAFSDPIK